METIGIIGNIPHVIEKIFKHLPARDLCNYSRVSKLWNSTAQEELSKRIDIVQFVQILQCERHISAHHDHKCCFKNAHCFEQEFHEKLHNLKIKPAYCIAFGNSKFWENFERLFPSYSSPKPAQKRFKKMYDDDARQKYLDSVIRIVFKDHLPSNCEISFYIGERIIACQDGCIEEVQAAAISGYLFSDLPGEPLKICKRKEHGGDVIKFMASGKDIKCALSFAEHKHFPYFSIALKEIENKFHAFSNGIVYPVTVGSNNVPLFLGPNVWCYTMSNVMDHNRSLNYEVLRTLVKHFKCLATGKKMFAFMFGDIDFGSSWVCRELSKKIVITGLYGYPKMECDSNADVKFYDRQTMKYAKKNFSKMILLSFDMKK